MNPTPPAWILLTSYATLKVKGPDAARLLQGQLTANIDTLAEGDGQLAALCQPQGRVVSLFRLFRTPEGFALNLPADLLDITHHTLKKYAVFYKASLEACPPSEMAVAVTTTHPSETVQKQALAVARCKSGLTYLFGDTTRLQTALAAEQPQGEVSQYPDMLIERGIPELNTKTSGQFLPHDLNLIALGAVSLTKGCYTGQEIITRMQHRATLKKHGRLATPPHRVHAGDPVFVAGQTNPVGTLINATDAQVLMLVDDEAANTHTLLTEQHLPYQSLKQVPTL